MELNWSTFLLEIINFLVLLWILKHFLYQPVLGVIARRQAAIEQSMAQAQQLHSDAEALQAQYQNRLGDWQKEREQAHMQLQQDFAAERERQLAALQKRLAAERDKARVLQEQREREQLRNLESGALTQGAQFAAQLLQQLAGPALEQKLVALALERLEALAPERRAALRGALGDAPHRAAVSSAFTLPDEQRRQLESVLQELAGEPVTVRYGEDAALLAGVRVVLGPWVFDANLGAELKAFAEFGHVGANV